MKNYINRLKSILLIGAVFLSSSIFAQTAQNIEVVKLKENFYRLTSKIPYEVNFLAYVTKEGILLVDAGQRETGNEIRDVLKTIATGNSTVKILINTHAHVDHTGGNIALAGEPTIIGADILRSTFRNYAYVIEEYPDNALPSITFTDSMTVYFGDEKIRLIAMPGSHDRTDIIVDFTKSGIVCLGDISEGLNVPSIDPFTGNLLNYPVVINRIITLIPNTSTIVSGHGKDLTVEELRQLGNMIDTTAKLIKTELSKAKTIQMLLDEDILKPWAAFGMETKEDRDICLSALANAGPPVWRNATIKELYDALMGGDGNAAVAKYLQLKKDFSNQYNFNQYPINRVGKWLLGKNRIADAITLFEFCTKEFPNSWNAYDNLGAVYEKEGNTKLAIENYKKSLELNPGNTKTKNALKKLGVQ
jgi:cyclase